MSITGDTANRLGFNPLQRFVHFTRKIRSLFLRSRTSRCLRTRRHMVFRRVPLTTFRCSSNPTVVLHLLAPSQPESPLGSTKPEPIVTCSCTGKLPGMKYSSVSLSLGWSFPQDVMALLLASRPSTGFSRVPVNRPSPSSVY